MVWCVEMRSSAVCFEEQQNTAFFKDIFAVLTVKRRNPVKSSMKNADFIFAHIRLFGLFFYLNECSVRKLLSISTTLVHK